MSCHPSLTCLISLLVGGRMLCLCGIYHYLSVYPKQAGLHECPTKVPCAEWKFVFKYQKSYPIIDDYDKADCIRSRIASSRAGSLHTHEPHTVEGKARARVCKKPPFTSSVLSTIESAVSLNFIIRRAIDSSIRRSGH